MKITVKKHTMFWRRFCRSRFSFYMEESEIQVWFRSQIRKPENDVVFPKFGDHKLVVRIV